MDKMSVLYHNLSKEELITLLMEKDKYLSLIISPKTEGNLSYYQRNKVKLSLKAKLKYQEQKKLGLTPHQLYMKNERVPTVRQLIQSQEITPPPEFDMTGYETPLIKKEPPLETKEDSDSDFDEFE